MTERQKLQQLFQYDLWCTRKLANLCLEQSPFSGEAACTAFLSHIVNAQEIWYHRVIGDEEFYADVWAEYGLDELHTKAKEAHQKWIDLIGDHEADLDSTIHYQNSKGTPYQNSLWQICHHLIIHGQHHRAQISLFLRNCDIVPPPTDYIHYARMGGEAVN